MNPHKLSPHAGSKKSPVTFLRDSKDNAESRKCVNGLPKACLFLFGKWIMHCLNQINTNENALPISGRSLKKVLRTKRYSPLLPLCNSCVPFIYPPWTDYGEMITPPFLSQVFVSPSSPFPLSFTKHRVGRREFTHSSRGSRHSTGLVLLCNLEKSISFGQGIYHSTILFKHTNRSPFIVTSAISLAVYAHRFQPHFCYLCFWVPIYTYMVITSQTYMFFNIIIIIVWHVYHSISSSFQNGLKTSVHRGYEFLECWCWNLVPFLPYIGFQLLKSSWSSLTFYFKDVPNVLYRWKIWTAGRPIQHPYSSTRDLRVTCPILYTLGHDCPHTISVRDFQQQGSRLTFCTGCTGAPNFFS